MTDAAIAQRDTVSHAFALDVYRRLALSALVAAVFSWITVMSPTIGGWVYNLNIGGALRLSAFGLVVAVAPFVLWSAAYMVMTRPRGVAGAFFFWTLSVAFGWAAHVILHLVTSESATSVFIISALGFSALGATARVSGRAPGPLAVFAIFALVTLAAAVLLDVVLTQTRFYFAVDTAGGLMIGLLAARAAPDFAAIHRAYEFSHSTNAVTDFAALSVFLPRSAPAAAYNEEDTP